MAPVREKLAFTALNVTTGPVETLTAKLLLSFLASFQVDLEGTVKKLDAEIREYENKHRRIG